MVRVGAKRERPCMVLLSVAIRSAAQNSRPQPSPRAGDATAVTEPSATACPARYVWKSRGTARFYASAVLSRIRAWWEMLGGVRYGLPDAVQLASVVWEGEEADHPSTTAQAKKNAKKAPKAAAKRQPRPSATTRRSGILRCAVQLSRSLYGDAAALHLFRAACACVTEIHVSMPLAKLTAADDGADESAEEEEPMSQRSRRQQQLAKEPRGPRMEQGCHAAVRVARVEHLVSSRRK